MRIAQTRTLFGGSKLAAGVVGLASAAVITVGLIANSFAVGTVVVTPTSSEGWTTGATSNNGGVNFIEDTTSPYPDGALRLTTGDSTSDKAQYMKAVSVPLAEVTELSYWTKQNAGPAEAAASYQLAVDLNGDAADGFTTLVYEPYWNGTVQPTEWQEWDVDSGKFWSSRAFAPNIVAGGGGAPFYTLSEIQAWYSDAVVLAHGVNVGKDNINYDVEVDGVNFNGTVYDFELATVDTEAPTAPVALGASTPVVACGGSTSSYNVVVDWTDATDNVGVVGYQYEVTTPHQTWTNPTVLAESSYAGAFTDGEGEYTYRVRAVDAAGNYSEWSNSCTVTYQTEQEPEEPAVPVSKDDCKNNGWQMLARADGSTFKNQGQCVAYVASSENSRHHRS